MAKVQKLRNNEYYDMQKVFDSLYTESLQGKKFNNLIGFIANEENIMLAYRNIKKNKGSNTPGVDGYDIKDIEKLPMDKFIAMIQRKISNYSPNAVRRVEIPKPNGKTRPLGIPTVIDRIIQQCILQVMEPICEAKFYKHSYGFRPDRSAEHAIARCYNLMQLTNLHYVVDADIKGFFDNVNHKKLIKQIWSFGIQDKNLICIIKKMLKAEIVMQDNSRLIPDKGTPQGGVLSPLLANIVLNELDWWIAKQWEYMPCPASKDQINKNGSLNRGNAYKILKRSNLKEMYIVRYADDFKIFCRNVEDANRIHIAVTMWLNERLQLEVSEEKSGITNLRNHYTEFLGFKLKVHQKGKGYVVKSDMSDKAFKKQKDKLCAQICAMKHPASSDDLMNKINVYNSMVLGVHTYYRIATNISASCAKLQFAVLNKMEDQRLNISKKGNTKSIGIITKMYGSSKMMRYIDSFPIAPIGYISTKRPTCKKIGEQRYTAKGRELLHESLKFSMDEIIAMMRNSKYSKKSVLYLDNRISLYAQQYGKCGITGQNLTRKDIHCHHKVSRKNGGTDDYENLIIVKREIHILIHSTDELTINKYLHMIKNETILKKLNKLRILANNKPIVNIGAK